MTKEIVELSIIVPCFNEEESIVPFINEALLIASKLPSTEIIFINDGSTDQTEQIIRSLKNKTFPFNVRLLNLSRNWGHQKAVLAGMQNAKGKASVTIDVDLQDPIEVILQMIEKWKNGAHIVMGQRTDRSSDTFFKRWTASIFYKLMRLFTKSQFPEHVADFRLIDRTALNYILQLNDYNPYWRGLVAWVGFNTQLVTYKRGERKHGTTKYPFNKMTHLALDAIFSFSKVPLQISTLVGFLVSLGSFFFGLIYVILKLVNYQLVPGWTAIFSTILFLGGLQLVCIGILGQYIGRIFEQVQGRPRVIAYPMEDIYVK